MQGLSRKACWIIAGLAMALCGCKSHHEPSAATAEASVKPGINIEYSKAGLNTTQWVARFERPGREVYDQRHEIIRALKLRPGSTVADIGAGTGLFTFLFAETVGREGKVYAIDIAPDFVKLVKARAAEGGWQNVHAIQGNETTVPLPRHSTDLAFLCDVYHHLEYPRTSLSSIYQGLRPGGELVIIDYRRIPGRSSDWVLGHVRAGQEEVIREVTAAGFGFVEEQTFLKENYFLRFRKGR